MLEDAEAMVGEEDEGLVATASLDGGPSGDLLLFSGEGNFVCNDLVRSPGPSASSSGVSAPSERL